MKRVLVALVAAAVLGFSGAALAMDTPAASPSCERENGCAFSACYGAPTAAVHYVCDCSTTGTALTVALGGQQPVAACVAGSDSNNGTSPATPWQTWSKGQTAFNTGAAGDQVLFCKGGSWDLTGASSNRWSNTNSTAASRVVAGTYSASWAVGTEGRALWKNPLGNYAVDFDHSNGTTVKGYVFAGIAIQGLGQPATPSESSPLCGANPCPYEGFFVYNGVTDVLLCDMDISYMSIGMENGGGNANEDNARFIVRNTVIHDNENQGLLGHATGWEVRNNFFDNNGFGTVNLDHHFYMTSGNASGVVVDGNEFYKNAQVGGASCRGAMLVMHSTSSGTTISHNYMHEDNGTPTSSCYCIGINPGYTTFEGFSGVVVTDNLLVNCGGEGISLSACHNCSADSNICLAGSSSGYECVAATNDGQGSGGGDWDNDLVKIRNNTCWGPGCSIRTANTGTNITVANNVMNRTDSGTVTCFTESLTGTAYTFVNNNACIAPGTVQWNATTLAAWRTASGFDGASIQGTAAGFTNPRISLYSTAAADFTPATASVLIAAGNSANGVSVDFLGTSYGSPPEIGALKYTAAAGGGKPASEMFIFVSRADDRRRERW